MRATIYVRATGDADGGTKRCSIVSEEYEAMPVIRFKREHLSVDVPEGANLRQVALDNGIEVYQGLDKVANCRGRGLCGTCRMEVSPERAASPRSKAELKHIKFGRDRLSCQTYIYSDCTVTTKIQPPEHDRVIRRTRVVTHG